jgi:KamA family protein
MRKGFEKEIEAIRDNRSLSEIILSGGDPLSLSNQELEKLIQELNQIPHIKRIRFHTRFPIGIPERIDAELLNMMESTRPQIFFVIHSNHPNEWDQEIQMRLKHIQKLGIPILCQTVLLKGVNDDIDILQQLCEILVDQGIIPYYLHQLDRVLGASHFEVPKEKGRNLITELTARLSGYAIPKYVQEISGEKNKVEID